MTVPPPTATPDPVPFTNEGIPKPFATAMASSTSTAGLLASTEARLRADISEVGAAVEKAADRLWGTYGLSGIALVIAATALFRTCH